MKHLYFCRHGESQANLDKIYAGQLDSPLTEQGRNQAQTAAEQARGYQIDTIVSSPQTRAHETAEIIATVINYPTSQIIINENLRERNLGSLSGQPYSAGSQYDTSRKDIETEEAMLLRAKSALRLLQKIEGNVLVVSHGAIGDALYEATTRQSKHLGIPNAEIVQFV